MPTSVIFKDKKGQGSDAQFQAFKDTWHWGEASETAKPAETQATLAIED